MGCGRNLLTNLTDETMVIVVSFCCPADALVVASVAQRQHCLVRRNARSLHNMASSKLCENALQGLTLQNVLNLHVFQTPIFSHRGMYSLCPIVDSLFHNPL